MSTRFRQEANLLLDDFVLAGMTDFDAFDVVAFQDFCKILVDAFDGLDVQINGEQNKREPDCEKPDLCKGY